VAERIITLLTAQPFATLSVVYGCASAAAPVHVVEQALPADQALPQPTAEFIVDPAPCGRVSRSVGLIGKNHR
jgi:hypothetical protein